MTNLKSNTLIKEKYTDCTVEKVTKEQEAKYIHTIHLSVPNEEETVVIHIQNSFENIMFQLQELKEGRKNQCYFAKGLTNVDIVRDEQKKELYIVESQTDNTCSSYRLKSIQEIETLIENMKHL